MPLLPTNRRNSPPCAMPFVTWCLGPLFSPFLVLVSLASYIYEILMIHDAASVRSSFRSCHQSSTKISKTCGIMGFWKSKYI